MISINTKIKILITNKQQQYFFFHKLNSEISILINNLFQRMHPSITDIIGISYEDYELEFTVHFAKFSMNQDFKVEKMSSEELNELITKLGDDELQKWETYLSKFQFVFVKDSKQNIDDNVPKIQNYILLFEIGDDLQEISLDHLKDSQGERSKFFIIIAKPKIRNASVNKIESQSAEILTSSLNIKTQRDMIIQICLRQPYIPFGNPFVQALCKWAKIKDEQSSNSQKQTSIINAKQAALSAVDLIMSKYLVKLKQDCSENLLNGNFEEAIIYVPKLQRQKFAQQIKSCRELKQFLDTLKTELTQEQVFKINLNEGLQAIIKAYNLSKPEDCLQQLLERHPQDAVLMVQKKNRAKFLKEIQSCQLYQKFLQSFQQQNLVQTVLPPSPQDLKKQAEPFLRSLLEKYSVKMKQECIQEIFEKNIEDAVLRAGKKERRNSFQQEILACENLTAYWKSLQNPNAQSLEEIMRRSAEAKINELLEQYGAGDVQEICKAILENKLSEIISQIPSKHRQKFKKDCENCEELQLYLTNKQKQSPNEIDPKMEAIQSLEKLLEKYNVKIIKDGVVELLESNLDDALLRVRRDLREPFKKDLNQCLPYLNYIDSLKKPNEVQVFKKEAEAEMLSLLDKYDVSSPEDVIQDLMKGNIAAALSQIPTKTRPLFKEDYEINEKIRQFLSSIIEKPSESAEQIASRALLALISKFNIKKPNDCLKELLQGNIDDAALRVKSQQRQKFKLQVKKCQQYQQYLNGSKSGEEPLKLNATQAVYSIFDKYKVKAKEVCLEEVFSKNLQDASLRVKRQMRQGFINELNQCRELKAYWELLDHPNEADLLKIQAISAATKILENYDVTDVQQCLAKILQFQLEDIKGQVKKGKVNSFMSDLNNCEALKRFWATNAPEVIDYEKEARKSLENICREFKVTDVKQCIDECIAKRIEDAALNVRRTVRDAFIRAINECQQYQTFLGSTNKQIMLLKKAESSLVNIFQKYGIADDIEDCLKEVLNKDLETAAKNVKSNLRDKFIKQLKECSDYNCYLESLIPEVQNARLKKSATSSLRAILIKYFSDASDIEWCLALLLQNQIDQALKQIKKYQRNEFQKELENSVEYQAYLKSLNDGIDNKYKLVKQELTNAGLVQSKIVEIISGLKQGSLQVMKQSQGSTKFYPISDKLNQNNDFFSSINENQAVNSGYEYEKEAIRIVKKIQREEKRALSNEEKQVYFDKAFNKSLQKLKLIAAPQQQLQNYFERTYEFYGSASSITSTDKSKGDTGKSAGLPRAQWKCDGKIDYPKFSESIIAKIFTLIGKESNKYIQFKKTHPTKVLDENARTDAKLEFVYKELIKNSTFETLFSKIDAIILKSSNYLNTTTITGIYIDVSREITQFNNDLCQVSHKLTLIFTGYIHLYAIYLTWKKLSEQALKVANRPYNELLQTRQRQLSFFINETSYKDNLLSEGEADRFLNKILEYCKTLIEDHKKMVNDNESKKFKKEYPRAVIQSKIDDESFNMYSKQQDWINYLVNPAKVIERKYESLINFSISNLQHRYKSCEKVEQLIKEFKEVINQLLKKLKTEGLTQDTIHTDIFRLEKKTHKDISVFDNEVIEKVNTLMMKFFLDLLVKDEKVTYSEIEFNLEIKKQSKGIKIHREPTSHLHALVNRLKGQELSITHFYTFVEIINGKLYERVNVGGVEFQKFDLQIKDMLKMNPDDEKDFRYLVRVKICNQLCPGCQRICGVEEAHTNRHECRYGHQMRAFGGVKLSNGDASVIRCQDMQLMSEIQFNGKKVTWKEFKEYWETKTEGSWSFADLAHDKTKEKFIRAWDMAGEVICKKFEMKYVKSNALDAQKAAMNDKPTHYIFALDDSGSMQGQKWKDLMMAYKTAIQAIRKISNAESSIRVSVLLEGSTCLLFQENSTPKNVNLNVNPRMAGNNFIDTFGKAYTLMTKYVGGAKINFIFMTDGTDSYPSYQITMIKNLMNSYPDKIEYSGIEFQTNGETMKLISKELGGTNRISYNVSQLTSAYLEIINRKI